MGSSKGYPRQVAGDTSQAMGEIRFTTHGPPKQLIADGESGIVFSRSTNAFLGRRGIELQPRGKNQHATYAERRGAFLKQSATRIKDQMREEDLGHLPV